MKRDPIHDRIAELLSELAAAHRELAARAGDEWVDQHASPLGARVHCRLIRERVIEGSRVGARYLARRSALDAYIESHAVKASAPREAPPQDADEALLDALDNPHVRAA